MMNTATAAAPAVNDRREIFGWLMYDWANSTFPTIVAGALFGPYLNGLAQTASIEQGLGDNGVVLSLGIFGAITAKSLFATCVSISVLLQVLLLPFLGSIADYTGLKKRLMMATCFVGAFATCCMAFLTGDLYLWGGLLFIIANLSFGASIVLYNAFLSDICTPERRDAVSSRGFALGYIAGGLVLGLSMILVSWGKAHGMTAQAVRAALLLSGVWWAGFALLTFRRLRSRPPARHLSPGRSVWTIGLSELRTTFRELRRLPHTLKFLIGYLFYNDGIQTVISVAAVFLTEELFPKGGAATPGESQAFILKVFLMTQLVAFVSALAFGRIAAVIGTRRAILLTLLLWIGVVIYAHGFVPTMFNAWSMSGVIAVALGGSQALSRSLFANMIPRGYEASFFSFYEVSARGTAWMGPLLFGIVVARTGSSRAAILSLIVFFVLGTLVLASTDTDRAIREAAAAE
jgi:UMF1 family MFS transporter